MFSKLTVIFHIRSDAELVTLILCESILCAAILDIRFRSLWDWFHFHLSEQFGVPHGVILGPVLLCLVKIIYSHSVKGFSVDTQTLKLREKKRIFESIWSHMS